MIRSRRMPTLRNSATGDTTSVSVCTETFAWMALESSGEAVDMARLWSCATVVTVGVLVVWDALVPM